MEAPTDQSLRLFGVATQIDLGNFAVGIATAFVAIVSLIISFKASKTDNRNKIADFRQIWIDDLRSVLSEFAGEIETTTSIAISHRHGSQHHKELDEKFGEIKRLETYIRLKLYRHEKLHRYIIEVVSQIRGRLALFAYAGGNSLPSEIPSLVDIFVDLSQVLLKREWDRVTKDVLGFKKRSNFAAIWYKIAGRKTFEQQAIERAEIFFHRINVTP